MYVGHIKFTKIIVIINNLLSIPIYEFQCQDELLIAKIIDQVLASNFTKSQLNFLAAQDYYFDEKLFDWFDQCIAQVNKLYFKDGLSLPITTCWINKSSRTERHHIHTHQNSILSGILYLTSHKKAETVFYYKNPYFEMGNNEILRGSDILPLERSPSVITGKINPVKGKLIIFPSSLTHQTAPNIDPDIRYTIGFNTFFSGIIRKKTDVTTDLDLRPVSVRERFKDKNG